MPVLMWLSPSVGGLIAPGLGYEGGLLFRTVHLFFLYDVQTGLVWATKILTAPSTTPCSTGVRRWRCCAAVD